MNKLRVDVLDVRPGEEIAARLVEQGRDLATPFLIVSPDRLRQNARRFREAFPSADLYYAVKSNPHPDVLAIFAQEKIGFEISSDAELSLARAAGWSSPLISSNPIKTTDFIRRAMQWGVDAFAVDSPGEVSKIAQHAPGASVYVRLLVDNSGSEWPLARKYGVEPADAVELLTLAADRGLRPTGTTFHVGSQCRLSESWEDALTITAGVWDEIRRRGIELQFLSIGGGFPVRHTREIPSLENIGSVVSYRVAELFPGVVRVALEPGRALVGDAALLGASVIGKARRGHEQWVYLDVGVFNGLMEAIEGFSYHLMTSSDGPRAAVVLAGPSCDSVDVIGESVELPDLDYGDRVYFLNAGAYTLSYASSFNGWPPPTVHFRDAG